MKLKRKDYVLLILICIVIVAIGLPMLVKWKGKSNLIQTEGFDNIRGINLVGIDKNSFLQSKIYDSASEEKGKCYNFKLRKMNGIDTIFYMKSGITNELFYEKLDKTGGMKWFFMNGNKLSETTTPTKIKKIYDYEYIDFGTLKGKLILFMDNGTNKSLYLYEIDGDGISLINYKNKILISVPSFLINISFVKGDNKEYALYMSSKLNKISFKVEIDNGNIQRQGDAVKISEVNLTIEKYLNLVPVRIDGTMKNMTISPLSPPSPPSQDKDITISISNSLIVNQFKQTKDYNTLDTMLKDSTIIGATSYNNSVYIVGFFKGKYSEINQINSDNDNVMEMIKLKVFGNVVIIESIVSFPNTFINDATPTTTNDLLTNLLVLNNQIIMHYKGKLYTIWDGSKDPSYITRPRRAKASFSGKYLITDEVKLDTTPLPSISNGSTESGPISMKFVLKEENVKDKKRIVPMGLVLKHNSATEPLFVKRFKFDSIDSGSSFGFYDSGESNDVSEIKKETEYYFLFQEPKPLNIISTTNGTTTDLSVTLQMILTDIGTSELVTKFEEGKAVSDLSVNISVKLLYYIFEEGVSSETSALKDDKCKKLETYIAEIEMGKSDFTLNEDDLKKYNKLCEDEYKKVMDKYDMNNLSDIQLKMINKELQVVYNICNKISEGIKGKNLYEKEIAYKTEDITSIETKLNELTIDKEKMNKNRKDPKFLKGFSDSYNYFLGLIKRNIAKLSVKEDDRTKQNYNNLKDKMNKYNLNRMKVNKQLCKHSDYNYNIDSMLDNMNMYNAYNKSIYENEGEDDDDDEDTDEDDVDTKS